MDTNSLVNGVSTELHRRCLQAATAIMDALFLCLWAVLQFAVQYVLEQLDLRDMHEWVLYAFQMLFSLATLAPCVIWTYTDIQIMAFQAGQRLRQTFQNNLTVGRNRGNYKKKTSI